VNLSLTIFLCHVSEQEILT